MTDLERLIRQIADNLSADPARAGQPLTVAALRDSVVPYRANRKALQLESSEDYELALMQLCAGEGGFARMEAEEIGKQFADELGSPNPDLSLLRQHETALLTLDARRLHAIMTRDPHRAFAPPAPVEIPERSPRPKERPPQLATPATPSQCGRCRADLPVGRVVNFCPQCGYDQRRGFCPQCNTPLEAQWRHCVSCGTTLPRS
jgi:Double zinc ribbon